MERFSLTSGWGCPHFQECCALTVQLLVEGVAWISTMDQGLWIWPHCRIISWQFSFRCVSECWISPQFSIFTFLPSFCRAHCTRPWLWQCPFVSGNVLNIKPEQLLCSVVRSFQEKGFAMRARFFFLPGDGWPGLGSPDRAHRKSWWNLCSTEVSSVGGVSRVPQEADRVNAFPRNVWYRKPDYLESTEHRQLVLYGQSWSCPLGNNCLSNIQWSR